MRAVPVLVLFLLIGFVSGCGNKADPTGGQGGTGTPADDKAALQGSWTIVKLDMGDDDDEFSKKIAADIMKTSFTVNGDIVSANDPKKEAKGPTHLRITLDPAKSPKSIDFLACDEKGVPKPSKQEKFNPATKKIDSTEVPPEPVLCIYKFEGDTLVVAVPVSFADKSPRPTEFKVKAPKAKGKPEDDKANMIVIFHLKKN